MARSDRSVRRSRALERALIPIVLGCLSMVGLACGGDDGSSGGAGNLLAGDAAVAAASDAATDGNADAGDSEDDNNVPCTPDFPDYHDGMTTKAGDLTVRLLSVSPAPPRQQTPNDWLIEIDRADQTPATDVTVSNADSFMPVHRHHGVTMPFVQATVTPGRTQINAINFKMRGPWQLNFDVTPAGGKPIIATFQVCVQ